MRTNSSTSSSESVIAFVALLAVLLVPYELLVRRSEARYGVRRSNVVMPLSLSPKIDALVNDLAAGERYPTFIVGTSRVEEGVRSDAIDGVAGPAFNLAMSGASALTGFEVIETLKLRPSLIIAGISPMDFTDMSMRRGVVAIRGAHDSIVSFGRPDLAERGPAATARAATYALLHGATPNRRRNLGQWLDLLRLRGDLLKFVNNADAVAEQEDVWVRGFSGVPRIATPSQFRELQPANITSEYRDDHAPLFAQLQAAVARQRARGTAVVFVRLPLAPEPRALEDATGFDADIRALAARCGVRYIDGRTLVSDAFIHDRRNFVDGGHLNVSGATQFSRALAAALRSLWDLQRNAPAGRRRPTEAQPR
jgi:hypothetical protein